MIGRERAAYLFLSLLQSRTGSSYMSRLGDLSPVDLMDLTPAELAGRIKMTDRASKIFAGLKNEFDPQEIHEQLEQKGARFVTFVDADYPARLADIPDPPPALFVTGDIPEGPAVALVGSRKASPTGLDAARRLARALGGRGVCVVSGLALGIDAAAHRGAVEGAAPTVGVLGSGIDVVYPRSNRGLFEQVKRGGGIVSEYYLGEAPLAWRFPARNRIIAGLADVLVVVEAAEKSGALITARHALDSGRDVWAAPGPLGAAECRGSNKLLADGAGVIWDIPEFVEEIAPQSPELEYTKDDAREPTVPEELPKDEARVLAGVGFGPSPVDAVAGRCGMEVRELLSTLTILELKGYVTRDATGAVMRKPVS